MKVCAMYGCDAATPRNSKVCFEHIKEDVQQHPLVDGVFGGGGSRCVATEGYGEPTERLPVGSMYWDFRAEKMWIYTNHGWVQMKGQ